MARFLLLSTLVLIKSFVAASFGQDIGEKTTMVGEKFPPMKRNSRVQQFSPLYAKKGRRFYETRKTYFFE
jgi:hypothetical protein